MDKKDVKKFKGVSRELEIEFKRKYGPQHGKAGVHKDKRLKKKYKETYED
jgi:hypothetical protein